MCFLSLPPSITVVSEKDNLFNNINKNFNYDSTPITLATSSITLLTVLLSMLLVAANDLTIVI